MKVIVTGSSGFIGRHVVHSLQMRGDDVIGLDRKTGVDLPFPMEAWNPRPDAIIHLASTCSTPGSLKDPIGTFRDTVITAVNVIESARAERIPVVITSSVKARDGQTPYGASKRMVETWALEARAAFGIPIVINRPGTIYGPGQEGSDESGWIAWFCKARDEGLTVTINGDGDQVRDLLHVDDYVRLLLMQIDDPEYNDGMVFDVGGGLLNAVTVNDIVWHLGLSHVYGPPRYGDSRSYIGENDVPGWEPKIHWRTSETLAP